MRKILFFATLIFMTLFLKAQNNEPFLFTDVVKTSDSTKSSKLLYDTAKMWFVDTFKNPKEVIVLDDPSNNIIVGRGNIRYRSKIIAGSDAREGWIMFDVQIASKNGRYKYTFSNFIHEGRNINLGLITSEEFLPTLTGWSQGGSTKFKIRVTNEIKDLITDRVELLIKSLVSSMNSTLSTKENW